MIESFRHRGLKRLYEQGDGRKARAHQLSRISDVLAHLDRALSPVISICPAIVCIRKGQLKGCWSVTVSWNWRIVFRFEDGDAFDVDLVDYH